MRKLRTLTDKEINKLNGESVTIRLNKDPTSVGGFSFVLKDGDRIYVEGNLDDLSFIKYLREIE